MKRAMLKKACKWSTPEGGTLEVSSGFPLVKLIELMRFSLSDDELQALISKFTETLKKRSENENNHIN